MLNSAVLTIATIGRVGAKSRQTVAEVYAAVVIGICLFGQLGAIGLVGPDEPRYAWIARAMSETGDWITPRLYGAPWFEKPVFYYWLAGLGFKIGFSPEWAARLPSAFAALAATIAIGWLARRFYSRDGESSSIPAILAAIVFASSVAAIGFARAATPDMLFSASITLAMACAAFLLPLGAVGARVGDEDGGREYFALALFGAFLGFGVLAKGPAAVILAGGAIAIWAAVTKEWRAAIRLAHPMAIVAFCLVALPWYATCALRNPDFLRVFIFEHNFERYLTPMFQHIQPFWFFIPIAFLAVVPWVAFLAAAMGEAVASLKSKTWRSSPAFFFACWALFPILFFSLSKSKLPSYILPGIPALSLLATESAVAVFRRSRAGAIGVTALVSATWAGLIFAAVYRFEKLPQYVTNNFDLSAIRITAAAIAVTIAALLLIMGAKQKFFWLVAVNSLLVAGTLEIANSRLLPALDPFVSARLHGMYVAQNSTHRFFTYELQRSWVYGLAFYAHRELPDWTPDTGEGGTVLTTAKGYAEIRHADVTQRRFNALSEGILYVPVGGSESDSDGNETDAPVQAPNDRNQK
jgi:4-amino-4-deoxy-L-arabinose transferase-like glycosyltransferase